MRGEPEGVFMQQGKYSEDVNLLRKIFFFADQTFLFRTHFSFLRLFVCRCSSSTHFIKSMTIQFVKNQ